MWNETFYICLGIQIAVLPLNALALWKNGRLLKEMNQELKEMDDRIEVARAQNNALERLVVLQMTLRLQHQH